MKMIFMFLTVTQSLQNLHYIPTGLQIIFFSISNKFAQQKGVNHIFELIFCPWHKFSTANNFGKLIVFRQVSLAGLENCPAVEQSEVFLNQQCGEIWL